MTAHSPVVSLFGRLTIWQPDPGNPLGAPPPTGAGAGFDSAHLHGAVASAIASQPAGVLSLRVAAPGAVEVDIHCEHLHERVADLEDALRPLGLAWHADFIGETAVSVSLGSAVLVLAEALRKLHREGAGWCIIEVGDELEHYVQFLRGLDEPAPYAEAVSSRHLPSGQHLTRHQEAQLRLLGWAPPNGQSRNFWRSPENQRNATLAAKHAIRTLHLVYGHLAGEQAIVRVRL